MDYSCPWLFQLGVHMLLAVQRVQCLLVTDINVPQIVDFRNNVTLSCSYDISGHTLNSVKWYKNEMEFFRYSPLMQPVYMKFPVRGVQLIDDSNECNESSCRVELNLLGIKSSGIYRCEVSGDAPHFKLSARAANMTVESLPQINPLISSFHSMYRLDEFVQANCSTDFSSLATKLTWFINNVQASFVDLLPSIETTITAHDYNLRRITSQLNFYANEPRFHQQQLQQLLQLQQQQQQNQQLVQQSTKQRLRLLAPQRLNLELRCVAEIESYPQLQRETSLHAVLFRDDIDLKNQKLIKSVGWQNVGLAGGLLLAVATATAAAITTQLLTPLTFQYVARKSTRYKNKMTPVSATTAASKAVR